MVRFKQYYFMNYEQKGSYVHNSWTKMIFGSWFCSCSTPLCSLHVCESKGELMVFCIEVPMLCNIESVHIYFWNSYINLTSLPPPMGRYISCTSVFLSLCVDKGVLLMYFYFCSFNKIIVLINKLRWQADLMLLYPQFWLNLWTKWKWENDIIAGFDYLFVILSPSHFLVVYVSLLTFFCPQLLAGLSKPTSGSILLQRYGEDRFPTEPPELLAPQRVGIVFQFPERCAMLLD